MVEILRREVFSGKELLEEQQIGYYTVDILVKELSLVVEVDGISHHATGAGNSQGDEFISRKTLTKRRYLESLGYKFKIVNVVKLM